MFIFLDEIIEYKIIEYGQTDYIKGIYNNKMEIIQQFLQTHYQTALPVMGILTGLLLLLAAKKEASWLFGDVSPATCNLKKLDGWINLFGKRAAKRMMYASAVFVIAASVFALILVNNE